jgi:hypothetical protein
MDFDGSIMIRSTIADDDRYRILVFFVTDGWTDRSDLGFPTIADDDHRYWILFFLMDRSIERWIDRLSDGSID